MRKRIILTSLLLGTVAVLGYLVHASTKTYDEDIILLANVEALSNGEGGSSDRWPCWSKVTGERYGIWVCGNPCTYNSHGYSSRSSDGWCYKN